MFILTPSKISTNYDNNNNYYSNNNINYNDHNTLSIVNAKEKDLSTTALERSGRSQYLPAVGAASGRRRTLRSPKRSAPARASARRVGEASGKRGKEGEGEKEAQ